MHISDYVLALAAALPLASAVPTNEARAQAGFTLHQVSSGRQLPPGPVALERAQIKFNGFATPDVVAAAAKLQQGTAPANPEFSYDNEYLTPATLGNTTLMFQVDSGSSDLWAFSSLQPAATRRGHAYYRATPAKRLRGQSWNIRYGDGDGASGYVYADKVVVGGVTATRQAVEAATSASSRLVADTQFDGIFGFAFSSLNTVKPTKQSTWFDNVKASLPSPIFASALKKGRPGSYDFGFIDHSKYTGDITYRPVVAGGFWQFHCGGYYVGNKKYGHGPLTFNAIADTGSSLMLLQTRDVKNYYANVVGAQNNATEGGYIYPCKSTTPPFSLIVNYRNRTVPSSYITYAHALKPNYCYGGIQDVGGASFAILGDIFLKSQYVVFDGSNPPRVGFAEGSDL